MNGTDESRETLMRLMHGQPLAVLATISGESPHTSLVAVAVTPDLRRLYFTTLRATRKWNNLARNSHVSLLMDNRSNQVADFTRAAAATIIGTAEELNGDRREEGLSIFLGRHPHLTGFASSPGCALFMVRITTIHLVTRFQNVMEFHFSP